MSQPPIPLPEIHGNIQPNSLRDMSEVEAAYIGAAIDTDGCIYLNKNVRLPYVTVSFVNTNLELISAFLRVTGVGSLHHRPTGHGWRGNTPTWTWAIGRRNTVSALLKRIAPYSTKAQRRLREGLSP